MPSCYTVFRGKGKVSLQLFVDLSRRYCHLGCWCRFSALVVASPPSDGHHKLSVFDLFEQSYRFLVCHPLHGFAVDGKYFISCKKSHVSLFGSTYAITALLVAIVLYTAWEQKSCFTTSLLTYTAECY